MAHTFDPGGDHHGAVLMNDHVARRSAWFGWGSSLAIHGVLISFVMVAMVPPESGFEFQAPMEVELGMISETAIAMPPEAPDEPTPVEPAPSEPTIPMSGEGNPSGAADAGPRRRRDAGVPAREEPAQNDLGTRNGSPVAFLPEGAQLALRIDLDLVRASPLGEDIAGLLHAIPDWQALLGDSGVDPVRDLSRVLIATPNMQRANIVIAGRLSEGAPEARAIAERLTEAHGLSAEWQDASGVPHTTWPSPDATLRDIALLGERHFVIARPQDLPRVLAIAAARRRRRQTEHPADALLSMESGEGLSIEVENAPAFVRRSPCPVPLHLRGGIRERSGGIDVHLQTHFDTGANAEEARRCLTSLANEYASNYIVALVGLTGPLERLEFRIEGEALRIQTSMRDSEARTIIGYLQSMLGAPSATRPTAPLSPMRPPPSPFE